MLMILIKVLHIAVAVFLILVVLLQTGKGAEMGAAFGGSSQTLFGGGGPAGFMAKLTTAAVKYSPCIKLAMMARLTSSSTLTCRLISPFMAPHMIGAPLIVTEIRANDAPI